MTKAGNIWFLVRLSEVIVTAGRDFHIINNKFLSWNAKSILVPSYSCS